MNLIDHPPHYTAHPSNVECIQITECLPFCLGNAVKYAWRAGKKGVAAEDLRKAAWYLRRQGEAQLLDMPVPTYLRTTAEIVLDQEPEGSALYTVLSMFAKSWVRPDEIRDEASHRAEVPGARRCAQRRPRVAHVGACCRLGRGLRGVQRRGAARRLRPRLALADVRRAARLPRTPLPGVPARRRRPAGPRTLTPRCDMAG